MTTRKRGPRSNAPIRFGDTGGEDFVGTSLGTTDTIQDDGDDKWVLFEGMRQKLAHILANKSLRRV